MPPVSRPRLAAQPATITFATKATWDAISAGLRRGRAMRAANGFTAHPANADTASPPPDGRFDAGDFGLGRRKQKIPRDMFGPHDAGPADATARRISFRPWRRRKRPFSPSWRLRSAKISSADTASGRGRCQADAAGWRRRRRTHADGGKAVWSLARDLINTPSNDMGQEQPAARARLAACSTPASTASGRTQLRKISR